MPWLCQILNPKQQKTKTISNQEDNSRRITYGSKSFSNLDETMVSCCTRKAIKKSWNWSNDVPLYLDISTLPLLLLLITYPPAKSINPKISQETSSKGETEVEEKTWSRDWERDKGAGEGYSYVRWCFLPSTTPCESPELLLRFPFDCKFTGGGGKRRVLVMDQ